MPSPQGQAGLEEAQRFLVRMDTVSLNLASVTVTMGLFYYLLVTRRTFVQGQKERTSLPGQVEFSDEDKNKFFLIIISP